MSTFSKQVDPLRCFNIRVRFASRFCFTLGKTQLSRRYSRVLNKNSSSATSATRFGPGAQRIGRGRSSSISVRRCRTGQRRRSPTNFVAKSCRGAAIKRSRICLVLWAKRKYKELRRHLRRATRWYPSKPVMEACVLMDLETNFDQGGGGLLLPMSAIQHQVPLL